MNTKPALKLITLAVSTTLSPMTWATTTYVESFGDNANPCTKNLPCATIQRGIDQAGPNGRINVGPGNYSGSLLINNSGVRVVSVTGADATVISVGSVETGITIAADKVTFGQKKKGFRLQAEAGNGWMFRIASGRSKIKIEGNILAGPASGWAAIGGEFQSAMTVRNNWIVGWNEAIDLKGTNGAVKERFVITDNQLESNRCVLISSVSPSHAAKIRGNKAVCEFRFLILNNPDQKTNEKIEKNTIRIGSDTETAVEVIRGNPTISKNLIDYSGVSIHVSTTVGASVKDNLIVNNQSKAIVVSGNGIDAGAAIISGNTIVDSASDGIAAIELNNNVIPKTISKNNYLNSIPCPIVLTAVPSEVINLKGNFWDERLDTDGTVDLAGCSTETTDAETAELLIFAPATKANPVKYKSGF